MIKIKQTGSRRPFELQSYNLSGNKPYAREAFTNQ